MRAPRFGELIGAILAVGALLVVAYTVVAAGNEQALGALIAVVAAATGFYLRGKVERQAP